MKKFPSLIRFIVTPSRCVGIIYYKSESKQKVELLTRWLYLYVQQQ